MNRTHLVLIEPYSHACGTTCLQSLPELLESHFPQCSVWVKEALTHHRDDVHGPPDIALLRAGSAHDISAYLQALTPRWSGTPTIGLFCGAPPTLRELTDLYQQGLQDYVICPFRELDLMPRVAAALTRRRSAMPVYRHGRTTQLFRLDALVGSSHSFLDRLRQVPLLAQSDATVLITGETGTGKELFARAIHYHSPRQGGPFIPVNCAALPDQLFENELFGHTKGAFTHAESKQQGLIAEAEFGTLFLDEIDTLSLAAQTKLLRFLQDRCYRQLGSPKSLTANVRIIAATNANLRDCVHAKCFREDLFYRLNVLTLTIPSLRDRPEDIPLLAAYLLKQYRNERIHEAMSLSPSALNRLIDYGWPGNVRELEGVIQHAVVLASSQVLQPDDLNLPPVLSHASPPDASLQEAKSLAICAVEREFLTKFLMAANGNVSQAAKTSGTERRTFQRLLRKHRLRRQAFQHP